MALHGIVRMLLICAVGYSGASVIDEIDYITDAREVKTATKLAMFSNPPLKIDTSEFDCSYTIEINNTNVCQIRIDFEKFNLAPPTTVDLIENVHQRPAYVCRNDVFQVTNLQHNYDFLPPLCGDNSGQHLYVRVNGSSTIRDVNINLKIADRRWLPSLPQATWKIKVTQLECFNTPSKSSDGLLESIISSLLSKPIISTAYKDQHVIAPPGCLQYYPDRSGVFESFNYNGGAGPYIGNLYYATCFKRSMDVCGIKFYATSFNIAYRSKDNSHLDKDCDTNSVTRDSKQSGDYLFMPEAETADGLCGSKFCGTSAANQMICFKPPGPLFVWFRSDNLLTDGIPEEGYKFNYTVLNNCSLH